jgi:hypothetical protein
MMNVALTIYLLAALLATVEAAHLETVYTKKHGKFPTIYYRIAINLFILVPVLNFQYAWFTIKRVVVKSLIIILRFISHLFSKV